MTVQKCARITRIQHLEREIRELILNLETLATAEDQATSKDRKARNRFTFSKSRASKLNAQRHRDFMSQTARINAHLNKVKDELRTAYEDHRNILERDNERKIWWARERVRRVEEENRRAATTAAEAEAARRKAAERTREHRNREPEATQAADDDDEWRQEQEDAARRAQAERAAEEKLKREERARGDPDEMAWRRREAEEWLARQREGNGGY